MLITKETITLVDIFLLKIEDQIKDIQVLKDLRASGDSAKALRRETLQTDTNLRGQVIDGTGSFEYQERGRGPGSVPWGKIYTWLRYKKYGLEWADTKARVRLAFQIWNKIKKYGTKTHIQKTVTGVISDPVNNSTLDAFIEQLSLGFTLEASSDIMKGLSV
jgi:hypothetical protein